MLYRDAEANATSSGVYQTCQDGEWVTQPNSWGSPPEYGTYTQHLDVTQTWSSACEGVPADQDVACSACNLVHLPPYFSTGSCTSRIPEGLSSPALVGEGATYGVRHCVAGEATCEELTVTCDGKNWVGEASAPVPAPPEAEGSFVDVWFSTIDGYERVLKTASCETRTCQLSSLDSRWTHGLCGLADEETRTFAAEDRIEHTFQYEVSSVSSGTDGTMKCQPDGTWTQISPPGGGGSTCSSCSYEFEDTWRKNGEIIQTETCYNSCLSSAAPNYSYEGLNGLGTVLPKNETFSRCVYEDGFIASSSVYGCTMNLGPSPANTWVDAGADSTCPQTVDLLAEMAADGTVTPCETDNCVFWRSSWGNRTKTTDLP